MSFGALGEQRVVHLGVGADDHPVGVRQRAVETRIVIWNLDDIRLLAQPLQRLCVRAFGDQNGGAVAHGDMILLASDRKSRGWY